MAMTAEQLVTVATAVGAALGGVITLAFGKPVVEGVSRILKESHQRWLEKRKVRREETAEDEKRKAVERARQEKQNDSAHKQLIAYVTSELESLKVRFDRVQQSEHDCRQECAMLRAQNEAQRHDIDELQRDSARKDLRIERLESRLGGSLSDSYDRPKDT